MDNSSAYIYLRSNYYAKFKKKLEKLIGSSPIVLFEKQGGYSAGEETAVLEAIEGKKSEPKIKPPFPSQFGLWNYPTLINNVETFYYIAQIADNNYNKTRFYSIYGDVENQGAYQLPEDYSIAQILQTTKNWPNFDFFVQAGGGMLGEILLPKELSQSIRGSGAILVFHRKKTCIFSLMKKWANFLLEENCNKCIPCRESAWRLVEMMEKGKINEKILEDLLFVLEKTSFCAFGRNIVTPFRSLIKKLGLTETKRCKEIKKTEYQSKPL
jgi:NADH:ubiquinone oxidoreductase subunit F (NADH-binding)